MKLTKIALAVLLASGLAACNSSTQAVDKNIVTEISIPGVTLIESVKSNTGEINIPYKKYKLDNGLTLVLHQDKSDPLVHVDITYHVGSGTRRDG